MGGTDDKLRRYDLAGKLTGSFASPIDYFLEAMTAAPNGDIHVADQGSYVYDEPGAVWVLSRDGELKRGYLAPHSRNHIEGIAVAPDGSSYASDSWTDEVHRFSPTGAYLGSFGGTGVAPGQFDGPAGITIGTDGSVFVADRNNDRIQRFTASGKFLAAWGQAGDRPGELSVPQYLATTPPGNIIVGSDYFGPAQEFRPDGTHVSTFGGDDFWTATGVATDSRGAGYLTAKTGTYSHSILKFVPSSTTTASKVTQRYGKSAKLTVHVSPKPAGTVQVKVGKKTVNAPRHERPRPSDAAQEGPQARHAQARGELPRRRRPARPFDDDGASHRHQGQGEGHGESREEEGPARRQGPDQGDREDGRPHAQWQGHRQDRRREEAHRQAQEGPRDGADRDPEVGKARQEEGHRDLPRLEPHRQGEAQEVTHHRAALGPRPQRSSRSHGHASAIHSATASASGPSSSARSARTQDCTTTSCSSEGEGYR